MFYVGSRLPGSNRTDPLDPRVATPERAVAEADRGIAAQRASERRAIFQGEAKRASQTAGKKTWRRKLPATFEADGTPPSRCTRSADTVSILRRAIGTRGG